MKASLSAALVGEVRLFGYVNPVAVVSDRQLSVAALTALLLREMQGVVVQRARGTAEVAKMLRASGAKVVIAEGTWGVPPPEIRSARSKLLLVVDPNAEPATLSRLFRTEADGFVSQAASSHVLLIALDAVRLGGRFIDPALETCLFEAEWNVAKGGAAPRLSERERLIVAEIANGKSSKQIASELSVTAKTVCNHISNVYRKLNLTHRGELVKYAFDQGLTGF